MSRVFLTAEWRDLVLLNFAVPEALLEPLVPRGLVLDRYDGSPYVSLVAFDFLETRVGGIPWPGFTSFPEINLRFYVRDGDRRGVCFVREIVPKALISFIARALYDEPYVTAPITSTTRTLAGGSGTERLEKRYRLVWGGASHEIAATGATAAVRPADDSVEHFFKEHTWGFGRSRSGETTVYRVEHPVWDVRPLVSHELSFDFGAVYGAAWTVLNGRSPDSAVFAVGSPIQVFTKD